MPKKAFQVQLTLAERTRLQTLVSTGSATAHARTHARILLSSKRTKAPMGPRGPMP